MPKFKVVITQTAEYELQVTARSAEAAEKTAQVMFDKDNHPERYLTGIVANEANAELIQSDKR